jgi:hypothetical protein
MNRLKEYFEGTTSGWSFAGIGGGGPSASEVRKNFLDLLDSYNTRAVEEQKKQKGSPSQLVPDNPSQMIRLNDEYRAWLSANPSASASAIQAQRETYERKMKNLLESSAVRNEYASIITAFGYSMADKDSKKELTSADKKVIEDALKALSGWYEKGDNKYYASVVEYNGEIQKFKDAVLGGLKDPKVREFYQDMFGKIKSESQDPDKILKTEEARKQAREKLADAEFRMDDIVDSMTHTIGDWGYTLIMAVIFLFGGFLAANTAIHRPPIYRIFYFIWASIPLFTIPVFIYFILKRVRQGPLHLYGLLPLIATTYDSEMDQGFFMRWMRSPFTYYHDSYIDVLAGEYQKSLEAFKQN